MQTAVSANLLNELPFSRHLNMLRKKSKQHKNEYKVESYDVIFMLIYICSQPNMRGKARKKCVILKRMK